MRQYRNTEQQCLCEPKHGVDELPRVTKWWGRVFGRGLGLVPCGDKSLNTWDLSRVQNLGLLHTLFQITLPWFPFARYFTTWRTAWAKSKVHMLAQSSTSWFQSLCVNQKTKQLPPSHALIWQFSPNWGYPIPRFIQPGALRGVFLAPVDHLRLQVYCSQGDSEPRTFQTYCPMRDLLISSFSLTAWQLWTYIVNSHSSIF